MQPPVSGPTQICIHPTTLLTLSCVSNIANPTVGGNYWIMLCLHRTPLSSQLSLLCSSSMQRCLQTWQFLLHLLESAHSVVCRPAHGSVG